MSSLPPAPAPPRSPWQLVYGAALAFRARRLAARAERLPAPVVSIGNLHWGGGGKTPFTIALARQLGGSGRRVAVLSRGYGRKSRGALVVSAGTGALVSAAAAGDEPFEIASALEGVAVVVAGRRIEAGRLALERLTPSPDLFLLDDGFSHVGLHRDLDLLLFPAADPWGRGRLLPSGRLREPLAAARRADAAILTGAMDPGDGARLGHELARHGYRGPAFASAVEPGTAITTDGKTLDAGARLFAVAAIARPEPFFAALTAQGFALVGSRALRDHADYSERDLRAIETQARTAGAEAIVTTGKDRAKLAGRLGLPLAVLPIRARPEPALFELLDRRLAELAR